MLHQIWYYGPFYGEKTTPYYWQPDFLCNMWFWYRLQYRPKVSAKLCFDFCIGPKPKYIKTGRLKMSQLSILFLSYENLRKCFILFTYIPIDYLVHEITKEYWKNSHFGNMRAGFLLKYQNSLRCKISLICLWNIESLKQKLAFGYLIVPKTGQNIIYINYRLHLVWKITI